MDIRRIHYIDSAKCLGIILVVLGHLCSVEGVCGTTYPVRWLSYFMLPLFFAASGSLMSAKKETERDLKAFIVKRLKSLIVPYISFSLIYFLIDLLNYFTGRMDAMTVREHVISSVIFTGYSTLWFLPVLFVSEIFTYVLIKRLKKPALYVAAAFALAVIAFVVDEFLIKGYLEGINIYAAGFLRIFTKSLASSFFMAAGAAAFPVMAALSGKVPVFIAGAVLLLIESVIAFIFKDIADLNNMRLGNPAIYLLGSLSGTFGSLLILNMLPEIRAFSFFGKNALIIMATHLNFYILLIAMKLAGIVYGSSSGFVFIFITMIICFILEIPLCILFNRYFFRLLGRAHVA